MTANAYVLGRFNAATPSFLSQMTAKSSPICAEVAFARIESEVNAAATSRSESRSVRIQRVKKYTAARYASIVRPSGWTAVDISRMSGLKAKNANAATA